MRHGHKKCCTFLTALMFCLLASISSYSQLTIDWNNMYGSDWFESLYTTFETSDGNFIIGANAFPNMTTGNISDPVCGASDFWLIKTDADGNTLWDFTYGGTDQELLFALVETADGGFAAAGVTLSPDDCEVSDVSLGGFDCWVIKVDTDGVLQWDTRIGSTQFDFILTIENTSDGGLVIGGQSPGTFDNANNGGDDMWITKLDGTGGVLWSKSFGGDGDERLEEIRQTPDGGYILAGASSSGISGTKTTPNYGSWDFYLVKLNAAGNYVWDESYGGDGNDQIYDLENTPSDGGFIFGGVSTSGPKSTSITGA